jgi:RNA polymerase sigma-70 factor, ECF subfamily
MGEGKIPSDHAFEGESARRGDRSLVNAETFAALYDVQYPRVFRYLLGRLRDEHAAEELAAEVFAIALASLQRGAQPRQIGSWLVGIADHLASRYWRDRQGKEPPAQPEPVVEADPEELVIGRLESGQLWKCMGELSPEHRQVLLLRVVAGLSAREVGEIMSRSEEAVRSLQFRALTLLRQLWKGEHTGAGLPHAAD